MMMPTSTTMVMVLGIDDDDAAAAADDDDDYFDVLSQLSDMPGCSCAGLFCRDSCMFQRMWTAHGHSDDACIFWQARRRHHHHHHHHHHHRDGLGNH